jgi:GR25 family glycosyltransferase involved in LPS biosynthesis
MRKYFINMNNSIDRRNTMVNMYPGIIRVEAYDGKNLNNYNDLIIPKKTNASIYELGCTFSHIKAIITAYKNGDDGALIFEDDIYDTYRSKWVKEIDEIVANAPIDTECIILHCINAKEIKSMIDIKDDYSEWHDARWSSGAYYINKKGMKKIYDLCYSDQMININNCMSNISDKCIYSIIKSYNYTKPLFIHQIIQSTIHQNHINTYHKPAYNAIINYFKNIS